jgi:membrane protein YqaA with SNARE-associated domain
MAFSSAIPAWEASVPSSSSLRSSNGTTWRCTSSAVSSRTASSRFLLISWMTPIGSPWCEVSGAHSMLLVR